MAVCVCVCIDTGYALVCVRARARVCVCVCVCRYYLEVVRFSERQRRVTMGADAIGADAIAAVEDAGLGERRHSSTSLSGLAPARLPSNGDSPRPGVNARSAERQSRFGPSDAEWPGTPERTRKRTNGVSPLPQTPMTTGGTKMSYNILDKKRVAPSTKLSALRKAVGPLKDSTTKGGLFVRSTVNDYLVQSGSGVLRVFCDPQLRGR